MMDKHTSKPHDLRNLIGTTLRAGVTVACLIAAVGGVLYLVRHGGEPMPDYTHFSYDNPDPEVTTLSGILEGVMNFSAAGWIQLGVIALILTPVLRVALSLADFLRSRDWLYSAISAFVLAVIIANSLGG